MIKMYDIVMEGSYDAQGVADKAYERFLFPKDTENDIALKAMKSEEGETRVGSVKKTNIDLNPKSLEGFGPNLRAIGDLKGNLYVPQKDGNFIHEDIAEALKFDIYDDKVIRLLRLGKTKIFIAISNFGKERILKILESLQHRNPQYQFKYGV
jgi:hypothetical protein